MKIEFRIDCDALARSLSVDAVKQVPFATALTLTRLAGDAKAAVLAELPIAFQGPTAFTLNAVTTKAATKVMPESAVYFKDSNPDSGRAKNEHIRPGAEGAGARAQKKTEYLLTKTGDLPLGWVTVPGKSMPLDSNGNLAGAYYKQIVNVLQLKAGNTRGRPVKAISGLSQKRAVKLGVTAEIFAVSPGKNTLAKGGGWLPPGVYKHLKNRGLQQMLKFVRKASYKQRIDLAKVVADTVAKQLPARWDAAFNEAIASAIRGKA